MGHEEPTLASLVQDAIQTHLKGEGFPTDFVLVANYIDSDGDSSYFLTVSPGQTVSTTLGILRWGTLAAESDARIYFDRLHDEDD